MPDPDPTDASLAGMLAATADAIADAGPVAGGPGEPEGLIRDITDIARTAIFTTDPDGRTTFMNPAAEAMTGFSFAELRGRVLHEAIHDRRPDGRPFPIADCPICRHASVGGRAPRDHEDSFVRKDGSFAPVRCSASAIVRNGRLAGVVLEAQDLTRQRAAERALRESEERFRTMADGLPLIVWVHGAGGEQQFVNATFCEFFGVTREEMRGGRWQLLMHPDDADGYSGEFMACVRDRRAFHAEVRVCRADGEWRWIESWARPRFTAAGEFLGFVGTSADVTDRKRAAEALVAADRRKDEFLATLSHELRNPLAPISNSLALLERLAAPGDGHSAADGAGGDGNAQGNGSGERDGSIAVTATATMRRQLQHLGRLVDDLLDLSRITRGKIRLSAQPLELGEALRAVAEDVRPQCEQRGHQLAVSLPGMPLPVRGDPARLAQIVGNLLNNACKYTPTGGRIELSAGRDGYEAWIRVSDNGIGIAGEDLPRVFGMFERLIPARSMDQGGLGIGLSLVKQLVEMHGGTVTAHSDGAGTGSEFVVRLPVWAWPEPDAHGLPGGPADRAAPPCESSAPPRPPSRRRVLVVDDNRDAADSLAQLLAMLGHEARVAYDGPQAIEAADAFRPEAVLLDIGLPSMSGYEVCREVRGRLGDAARPPMMIALTGWGQDEDRRRSAEAGFDHHLVKPVEFDALERLIGSATPRA